MPQVAIYPKQGATYFRDLRNIKGGVNNSLDDDLIADNELSDARNYVPDLLGTGGFIKRAGITRESSVQAETVTSVYDGRNANYFGTSTTIRNFAGTSLLASLTSSTAQDWTTFVTRDIYVNGAEPRYSTNGSTFSTLTNCPTAAKYVETHNNFLFAAGHDGGKLRWADLGTSETWTATNEIIITNDQDNVITALAKFRDVLMVFCEKSFHHVNGFSTYEMSIVYSSFEEGCTSHRSVVVTPAGVFWWSKIGLVRSDGFKVDYPMIRKLQGTFNGLNASQFSLVHGVWVPQERCVRYWVSNGASQTSHNLRIDYYYQEDAFYLHSGNGCNISASGSAIISGATKQYVGGYTNLYLWEQTGNDDDGTAISSYLQTKRFNDNGPTALKRCEAVTLHTNLDTTATIDYRFAIDNGTAWDIDGQLFSTSVTTADADEDLTYGVNKVWRKLQHRIEDAASSRTKIVGLTEKGYHIAQ